MQAMFHRRAGKHAMRKKYEEEVVEIGESEIHEWIS